MVHRYLSREASVYISKLVGEGVEEAVLEEAVEASVRALLAGDRRGFLLVVNELALRSRRCAELGCSGILCRGEEVLALGYYERVLEALVSIKCLESLIPEVGGNLVYSPRGPGEPGEMVALDGRIVKSREGVLVAGKPRLGGSRHTAGILSAYSRQNPTLRWAIALSPKQSLLEALSRRGIPLVPLGSRAPRTRVRGVLEEAAPGREAVLYILAPRPHDIISLVEEAASRECSR